MDSVNCIYFIYNAVVETLAQNTGNSEQVDNLRTQNDGQESGHQGQVNIHDPGSFSSTTRLTDDQKLEIIKAIPYVDETYVCLLCIYVQLV